MNVMVRYSALSIGLFTFTDADFYPDSNPIPLLCSWVGNLNPIPCSAKSSAYYNVAIWFASLNRNQNWNLDPTI